MKEDERQQNSEKIEKNFGLENYNKEPKEATQNNQESDKKDDEENKE